MSVKKPGLSSVSIMEPKDHTMKSKVMAPKLTREWGQRQSSTTISEMVIQPAATCPKLLDNNTIFASEATAITLALNYYRYMGPVHHDVVSLLWLDVLLAGDIGRRY